jgi:hypothetical protein
LKRPIVVFWEFNFCFEQFSLVHSSMKNTEVVGSKFLIQTANENHFHFADTICAEMEESAKKRGTGIAKRSPVYIMEKMVEGKAIIATTDTGEWVGFCYIETWEHGKFVANSGLIERYGESH